MWHSTVEIPSVQYTNEQRIVVSTLSYLVYDMMTEKVKDYMMLMLQLIRKTIQLILWIVK